MSVTSNVEKAAKAEQILILEPKHELHFKGPYNEVVTSYLKLTNPSTKRVCFKVKTTAPKRYCVRPNNGIIEPKGNTTIAVMLQPFDIENQSDKNKHKFMVQTVFAPEGDVNQETLWKEVPSENIMDSKLKCVFDLPVAQGQATVPETGTPLNQSSTLSSTAASVPTVSHSPILGTESDNDDTGVSKRLNGDEKKYLEENKKLKEELIHLRQEIASLKEDGLKQRMKSAAGAGSATTPADLIAQQQVAGKGFEKSGNDLSQIILNPQMLVVGIVLFVIGVLIGKIVF
ncbi:VAMP-associated protein involved in inositol metabolism-like protein [Dinothrombium tinctorium]|uniref:VAMP-associated protein involved in inositol metabolism-like protein n=1 Tax=Dinothrombium tinctorium TaxID=1965070 RepID=A0A443QYN0_9ACAR|nr:VAMP-associated protein involved in inositol metabolism-like protein [Dinothrombium tinctorium]